MVRYWSFLPSSRSPRSGNGINNKTGSEPVAGSVMGFCPTREWQADTVCQRLLSLCAPAFYASLWQPGRNIVIFLQYSNRSKQYSCKEIITRITSWILQGPLLPWQPTFTLACIRSFTSTSLSRDMKIYFIANRIYNKVLDRDWFSARLWTFSNRIAVIGYPRDFHVNHARFNGFLSNVFYSFQNLGKALRTFSLKRSS